ncbi:MAG: transcriptional regulator, TetR family [Verrucomicrobiaceae bacterium]|nr:transcriptional regulator, TetR family [Verrucomicrobiaceae bacterium]
MNEEALSSTRTNLMDAAERLFAEKGVEATSVRDITKAADANQGAINYHFQSKDKLVLEVFARRIELVIRQSLLKLDALEAAAAQPTLEQVLGALIRPMVEDEMSRERKDEFMRLISRSFKEPRTEIKEFVERTFGEMVIRFDTAILRTVPGLTREALFWPMNFAMGGMQHGLDRWSRFDCLPVPPGLDPKNLRPDREGFLQKLITFAAAGIRASV